MNCLVCAPNGWVSLCQQQQQQQHGEWKMEIKNERDAREKQDEVLALRKYSIQATYQSSVRKLYFYLSIPVTHDSIWLQRNPQNETPCGTPDR